MLTLLLLAAATPTPSPRKACAQPGAERAGQREPIRARRLGEMPPGKQLLTVDNSVDGCPKPIVVRDEVGLPRR